MLHLFLKSRRAPQSYDNDWIGDFRLRSVKTYERVAGYCREAMASCSAIRIHRRRFEKLPAMICGECNVKSVVAERDGFRVEFENWKPLEILRDFRIQQGYYFADPSEYEERSDANLGEKSK